MSILDIIGGKGDDTVLEQLKQRYLQYEKEAEKAMKEAGRHLWGWGDDPRNDACHIRFYEDVELWVQKFEASKPNNSQLYNALYWILTVAAEQGTEATYWYLYAIHGHCKGLIPMLEKEQKVVLKAYYDEHYPRRDRMPVQQAVYKLLCE